MLPKKPKKAYNDSGFRGRVRPQIADVRLKMN